MRRRAALAFVAVTWWTAAACVLFDGPGDYPPKDAGTAEAGKDATAGADSAADALADAPADATADAGRDVNGDAPRDGNCQINGASCNDATVCCSGVCSAQQRCGP